MSTEQEPTPYCIAARFTDDRSSGIAYSKIQYLIFTDTVCELSVYRLLIAGSSHVVVVGDCPNDDRFRQALESCLAEGTQVSLRQDLISWLRHRRGSERLAVWVERHHRPGLVVRPAPLFALGRLVITANLERRLRESDSEHWQSQLKDLIARHVRGDWGNLDEHDRDVNERALKEGGRLFSAYKTAYSFDVWVVTEADRSCTTALLPDDY